MLKINTAAYVQAKMKRRMIKKVMFALRILKDHHHQWSQQLLQKAY
jgi:hypothetical protein